MIEAFEQNELGVMIKLNLGIFNPEQIPQYFHTIVEVMETFSKIKKKQVTALCLDYNINYFDNFIFEEIKKYISQTHFREVILR